MQKKTKASNNRFKNKITKTRYGKFDSKKEYSYWLKLKRLESQGKIKELQRQVSFELIPAQYEEIATTTKTGQISTKKKLVERACSYVADFVWVDCATGEKIVADVKSLYTITPQYIIKRKLMFALYKIKIKEII